MNGERGGILVRLSEGYLYGGTFPSLRSDARGVVGGWSTKWPRVQTVITPGSLAAPRASRPGGEGQRWQKRRCPVRASNGGVRLNWHFSGGWYKSAAVSGIRRSTSHGNLYWPFEPVEWTVPVHIYPMLLSKLTRQQVKSAQSNYNVVIRLLRLLSLLLTRGLTLGFVTRSIVMATNRCSVHVIINGARAFWQAFINGEFIG